MNEVQAKLAALQQKGWTLAAIAREFGNTPNAVQKWKAGDRSPSNTRLTLEKLEQLLGQRKIPKKRHYSRG